MQQLGTNYFDSFGYDDEEFKDGDDSLQYVLIYDLLRSRK